MAKKKEQISIREFISQKDLDALLDTAFVEQAEAADELELELSDLAETTAFDATPDADDQRLISNDDIGALFKSSGAKGASKSPAPSDDIGSLVSQSDIDALLRGELDAPAPPPPAKSELEDDIEGRISQGDIDALLNGATAADADSEPEPDRGAGLVSQSDIDALLNGAISTDEVSAPEPVGGDGLVSQSDIDALFSGGKGASEDAGGSSLVSQSDIDALLGGGAEEAPEEEDFFEPLEKNENGEVISQSDIDALLKGALDSEEKESARDDRDTNERIVSQSDIDGLFDESPEAGPLEEKEPEPVILSEASETIAASVTLASAPFRRWYTKKVYQLSALAALIFIITSSVFLLMPRSPDVVPKPVLMTFPIPKPESKGATAGMQGDTNVSMRGFLVLAPSDNSDITCLAADLLLDFTDTTAVRMIKENEGFVRNIIYSVINEALLSSDKSAVDKTKLTLAVRAALGYVIPVEVIRSVSFGKFEMI